MKKIKPRARNIQIGDYIKVGGGLCMVVNAKTIMSNLKVEIALRPLDDVERGMLLVVPQSRKMSVWTDS